jgi:hypothetical protein
LGKKALEMNLAVCPLVTLFPDKKHGVPVVHGGDVEYPVTIPCRYTLSMYSQNVEEGGTSVKVCWFGGMLSEYPAALLTNLAV